MNNPLVKIKSYYTKYFVQLWDLDILLLKYFRTFIENKYQNFKYYGNK